jgi:FKBP-type peptidyl-prolyl cis-trans isomerase
MKKISIIFTLILGISFVSCCEKKAKNVDLKTGIDSLSYAIGVQNATQIKQYFPSARGLDTTNMSEFTQGFIDEMYADKGKGKDYKLGKQVASELKGTMEETPLFPKDSSSFVNKDAFVDAVVNILLDKDSKMTEEDARLFIQSYVERKDKENNAGAIEAEKTFLEENSKKEGVVTTESGLQYKVITEGKGEIPSENTKVKVHYIGTLTDGTVFDSSVERGEPFEFNTSGGVIPAWIEVSKMMPVGSKWIIYAPSDLAYGSRDMGTIPPYSTLIFEIEMLGIEK